MCCGQKEGCQEVGQEEGRKEEGCEEEEVAFRAPRED
jgi:hypothetical protein